MPKFNLQPQMSNQFAIDIYSNCNNLEKLYYLCKSINYDLLKKNVSANFMNDTQGFALEALENLRIKGVEIFTIRPLTTKVNYSDHFISCLFGNICSIKQNHSISKEEIGTIFTFIQFYSIRSLNENSKFDSESYVDSIHKQLFEKFYFSKI